MTSVCTLIPIVLLGTNILAVDQKSTPPDSIKVTVVGTLRTGIAAIGGETTGTTITANGITWELDLGKNRGFRKTAETLNRRKAVIEGTLMRRRGVEIKERWIVTVTAIRDATTRTGDDETGMQAKVGRAGTQVRLSKERDNTIVDISGTGIGSATITLQSKHWPKKLRVRLHLRGLESCKIANKKFGFEWSVSSTGKPVSRVSRREGRTEKALDRKSPDFTEVRLVGGNGRIPLKGGYFEVPLPAKLFAENPREITIHWIDFYRN